MTNLLPIAVAVVALVAMYLAVKLVMKSLKMLLLVGTLAGAAFLTYTYVPQVHDTAANVWQKSTATVTEWIAGATGWVKAQYATVSQKMGGK